MITNLRYATHLRASTEKAECIKKSLELLQEQDVLPRSVSKGFDSPYGIDKDLTAFLQSNFELDISKHPRLDQIKGELISGRYEEDNPVLGLEDGDLIADQICEYARLSSKMRKAFGIKLNQCVSFTDVLPEWESILEPNSYYSPVYNEDGIAQENMYLQVEICDAIFSVDNTNVFSQCQGAELKEVNTTIFKGELPIGTITALLISFPDSLVFEGQERVFNASRSLNDSTLNTYIASKYKDVTDTFVGLTSMMKSCADLKGQKTSTSIASELILSSDGTFKNGILHIRNAEFSDNAKGMFPDILESLSMLLSDHGLYNQATYASYGKEYNQILRDSLINDPVVESKVVDAHAQWRLGGISALTSAAGLTWWHEAMTSFTPDVNGAMADALVYVENAKSKSNAPISIAKSFRQGIEAKMLDASN